MHELKNTTNLRILPEKWVWGNGWFVLSLSLALNGSSSRLPHSEKLHVLSSFFMQTATVGSTDFSKASQN